MGDKSLITRRECRYGVSIVSYRLHHGPLFMSSAGVQREFVMENGANHSVSSTPYRRTTMLALTRPAFSLLESLTIWWGSVPHYNLIVLESGGEVLCLSDHLQCRVITTPISCSYQTALWPIYNWVTISICME